MQFRFKENGILYLRLVEYLRGKSQDLDQEVIWSCYAVGEENTLKSLKSEQAGLALVSAFQLWIEATVY